MNEIIEHRLAIQIILDCQQEMKCLNSPDSRVQMYFSQRKIRNIRLRKSNLSPNIKAAICSKFETKNEISGLTLVLYQDSSGESTFDLLQFHFLVRLEFLFNLIKLSLPGQIVNERTNWVRLPTLQKRESLHRRFQKWAETWPGPIAGPGRAASLQRRISKRFNAWKGEIVSAGHVLLRRRVPRQPNGR